MASSEKDAVPTLPVSESIDPPSPVRKVAEPALTAMKLPNLFLPAQKAWISLNLDEPGQVAWCVVS